MQRASGGGPPIYADFNKIAAAANGHSLQVHLTTVGTRSALARHHIQPREGMLLRLYDADADPGGNRDDLVAEGVAHYDAGRGHWVAVLDGQSIRHVSEVTGQPGHWAADVDWAAVHAQEGGKTWS